ncbi:MAG: tetratricopeptide repeat protein [Candidatus Melainabacteria bacterium]|nr:tetratricopeptide repeat protein [Candidatus Melainabacteria bacterium]
MVTVLPFLAVLTLSLWQPALAGQDALAQAQISLSRKDYRKTIDFASQALIKKPDSATAYFLRGVAYTELDQAKKGLEDLDRSMKLDPTVSPCLVHDMKARCLVILNQHEKARAELEKANKSDPQGWRYKGIGEIDCHLGKDGRALESFTKAIKIAPKDFWSYRARGDLLFRLGRYEEALRDYNQAIKIVPREPGPYAVRSKIYEKLGKKDLARKDLEQCNRLSDFSF